MTLALSFKEQVSAISLALRNPHVDLDKVEQRVNALWTKIQTNDPDYARLVACKDQLSALRAKTLSVAPWQFPSCLAIVTLFWSAISYLFTTIYSYVFFCGAQPAIPKPPVSPPPPIPEIPSAAPPRRFLVGQRQRLENPLIPDYPIWRKIEGDGNCFYTACAASFLNDFFHNPDKDTLIQTVQKLNIPACGEEKRTVLRTLRALKECPKKLQLFQLDRDNAVMTHFVKFFRYMAADYLEQHVQDFPADDTFNMRAYCNLVRSMGKPTMGNYEMVALSLALGWGPRVVQTDGTVYNEGTIPFMSQGNSALLFSSSRKAKEEGTGHYDLIYRQSMGGFPHSSK